MQGRSSSRRRCRCSPATTPNGCGGPSRPASTRSCPRRSRWRVMPRALLSVSNKAGLPAFARGLARLGYELYSTGGTLKALETASIDARPVSDLTGFTEIMDGRVKTLHPGVHGGLLARRDRPEHLAALEQHGLRTLDLLCVNLYPFVATASRPGVGFEEVVENIDIGGPAMIRAAAKNHASVVVVVRPEQYPR